MKVVILAAGRGSRLRPITDSKPKALVRVCGKPILAYQLEAYLKAGLRERYITVVIGYKAEEIKKYCKREFPGVNFLENKDWEFTNNMYSLYMYLQLFLENFSGEPLIINNGDCIYEYSVLQNVVEASDDLIACDSSSFSEESMKVKTSNEGKLVEISKSISEEEAFAVSIDLYRFSYKTVQTLYSVMESYIRRGELDRWTEVAINDLLKLVDISPLDFRGKKWEEIDNLEDLLRAERIFSNFNYKTKKVFVLDLDGTLYLGDTVFQEAVDFVKRNWQKFKFFFMTNNTSCSRKKYLSKLKEIGLERVNIDNILTPIVPLLEYLRKNNIRNVYCVCTSDFIEELQLGGIKCKKEVKRAEDIQAVIVGFDKELSYEKLRTASLLLKNPHVQFLLTHPDRVCPIENGFIPDAGLISLILEEVTGRKPDKVFGKPYKEILQSVLAKYDSKDIVIVGDRLYTDKVLADNVGSDFVLVLSGETKREDVEKEDKFPALILRNLGDMGLLE